MGMTVRLLLLPSSTDFPKELGARGLHPHVWLRVHSEPSAISPNQGEPCSSQDPHSRPQPWLRATIRPSGTRKLAPESIKHVIPNWYRSTTLSSRSHEALPTTPLAGSWPGMTRQDKELPKPTKQGALGPLSSPSVQWEEPSTLKEARRRLAQGMRHCGRQHLAVSTRL